MRELELVVVGSLNMDFVVTVENLPIPGETVLGSKFQMIPGGKGANQAVAVARLQARFDGLVGSVRAIRPRLAASRSASPACA